MKTKLAITAALALALVACGKKEADNTSTGTAGTAAANLTSKPDGNDTASSTDVMMNGTAVATPVTAGDFANNAAASDQFEIKSSQLAATKSGSAGVKTFAAMMIEDHLKATADLKTAAAQAKPAVTPAPALNAEQQANLDSLDKTPKGAAFDKMYAQFQVAGHENALALLQGYAARGDDPMLKSFAAKTAPVVQGHLAQAQGLAR